jgi:hypothetical protein
VPIPSIGGFEDEDDYLSTHFKLLREDFSRDLKVGFYDHCYSLKQKRIDSLNIYPDCYINQFCLIRDVACLKLKIHLTQ